MLWTFQVVDLETAQQSTCACFPEPILAYGQPTIESSNTFLTGDSKNDTRGLVRVAAPKLLATPPIGAV